MSSAPRIDFHRRRLGKAYRGRNAMMLCTFDRCAQGALPGDKGCWIQKWEVEKHLLQQQLDSQPMYERGKTRLVPLASRRTSRGGRRTGHDDRERRGEGSSKRARVEAGEGQIEDMALTSDIPSDSAHSHASGSDEAGEGEHA